MDEVYFSKLLNSAVSDIKRTLGMKIDSSCNNIIQQSSENQAVVFEHLRELKEYFETSFLEIKTKINEIESRDVQPSQNKECDIQNREIFRDSISTINDSICEHMVPSGPTFSMKLCKRQCKTKTVPGLSYCGIHFSFHTDESKCADELRSLAMTDKSFVLKIHKKYNKISKKESGLSPADKRIISVFKIIKNYVIESKPDEINIEPLQSIPLSVSDYKINSLENTNNSCDKRIQIVGEENCDGEQLDNEYTAVFNRMKIDCPAQEESVTKCKFSTSDYINHIYINDIKHEPKPLSHYEGKSIKLKNHGIRLGTTFYTGDSIVNVKFKPYSALLIPVTHVDLIDDELLYLPITEKSIKYLISQSELGVKNMGVILDNTMDQHKNCKEIRSLYNPLSLYHRTYLNFMYPGMLDSTSLMGNWDKQRELEKDSYKIGKFINNSLIQKYKSKHVLKYYQDGYMADPYTGYIYYPTPHGTVAIGIANVENVEYELIASHTSSSSLPSNACLNPFLSTTVAMFNKFEICYLISEGRNYLDPNNGEIVWYNKLVDGCIKYNLNYYKSNNHIFSPSDFAPLPIDKNLSIPLELQTNLDAAVLDSKDGSKYPYGYISYGFKHLTGTSSEKYKSNIRDDIDKYTCALEYIKTNGLFCSLGQVRTFDNINSCHMSQILNIGKPGQDGKFNEHISSSDRIPIDHTLLYDPQFMGGVNGLELEEIQKDIIENIIPNTNHHFLIGSSTIGCFIDPITKFIFSVRGCIPVCIGIICSSMSKVTEIHTLINKHELIKHFKFYYLDSKEIDVCRSHDFNYVDREANKIVYHHYFDISMWKIVYNLNYYKNPRGIIIPSFSPSKH